MATLDCEDGYWMVKLTEQSSKYAAFTSELRSYMPMRLPQGCRSGAQAFTRAMNEILREYTDPDTGICCIYLDDVLVFGKTEAEFVDNLLKVVTRLKRANMKLSAKKTVWYAEELPYCGLIFTPRGWKYDHGSIRALKGIPMPSNAAELQQFIAVCNWFRRRVYNTLPRRSNVQWRADRELEPSVSL